ncbi:MAG: type II toxin-antitoxin system HipA family toxin [Proteobacteria bacterium]|nr:type II toxin-antitoxin system HipA family toxin [Pseudomonadota bacterium]
MGTRGSASRARYARVERINVFLWDHWVGAVALDPGYGFYAFRYTDEFRQAGLEPAPLTMPVGEARTFLFTDLAVETYRRLPAMLADALPDDFGNALINRWMLEHGVGAAEVTPLDRLAYMGTRAIGALTFRPARGPGRRLPYAIRIGELVEEARRAVRGRLDDADHASAALRTIIDVGTSAGGARAKAVVAWNPQTQELRAGQLPAPPGFEHWLLKFDGLGADRELGASRHFGRIEFAYHRMARAAGIEMTDCRLLEEHGRAHFMTRRFDRGAGGVRHHVQTLCAMAHVDYKRKGTNSYAQLLDVVVRLGMPYAAREEAFRRMAFNVMARNCDDHSKNFSFRLRQGHGWELAPAYDVTFAHNPRGEWTHQHLMSVNGRFQDIGAADLLAVADRFAIGTGRTVLAQVADAVRRWRSFAAEAGLAEEQTAHIAASHRPIDPRRRA